MKPSLTPALGAALLLVNLPLSQVASAAEDGKQPQLAAPFATKSVSKFAKVVGWKEGETPKAPRDFEVSLFAKDLQHPRWIYVLPNGDVLVAEADTERKEKTAETEKQASRPDKPAPSANRITIFPGGDGAKPSVYLRDLKQPFGMCLVLRHSLIFG